MGVVLVAAESAKRRPPLVTPYSGGVASDETASSPLECPVPGSSKSRSPPSSHRLLQLVRQLLQGLLLLLAAGALKRSSVALCELPPELLPRFQAPLTFEEFPHLALHAFQACLVDACRVRLGPNCHARPRNAELRQTKRLPDASGTGTAPCSPRIEIPS